MWKKERVFGRKAQLTIFFIIGIFLIAVFALLFYINTRVAEEQLASPAEKLITDLLKTGAIPYYVGVCLEEVSEDGLILAGLQGGDIFDYQGGPAPSPAKFLPLFNKVTYGISLQEVDGHPFLPPPDYPGLEGGFASQTPKLDFEHWGWFGLLTLRKLCDSYGVNSPETFIPRLKITAPICQLGIYADELSTQWQLERYVEEKLLNCTNWTAIREETGYNVSPLGKPNVTVLFGLRDTSVDAEIPIKIEVGGKQPVFTIGDFTVRLPVRIKRIAEFATLLSRYDNEYLGFNISKDYNPALDTLWDTDMNISVSTPFMMLRPPVLDDIITIEDRASQVKGKNYVYRFVRENRIPALDWIHRETNWSQYDIIVMEEETIYINPNPPTGENGRELIYDPDEDTVYYYYTGWKETCNELFNFVTGKADTKCSEQEPTEYRINRGSPPGPGPGKYFLFPLQEWDGHVVVNEERIIDPEAEFAWTSSEDYAITKRNASYTPTHEDIGPHNVTVWVCDAGGLCDYQVVKILVVDYPMLVLNGTNHYYKFSPHIPYNAASVEDWYTLSADGSTGYIVFEMGLVQRFLFSDEKEPFNIITDETVKVATLPQAIIGNERDIRYVTEHEFEQRKHCDAADVSDGESCELGYEEHTIKLSIPSLPDLEPKQMKIPVYECLPHRNADDPYPWPYNRSDEPYLASHACCSLGKSFEYNVTVPVDRMVNTYNGYGAELQEIEIYDLSGELIPTFDETEERAPAELAILAVTSVGYTITNERIILHFSETQEEPIYTLRQISSAEQPAWGTYLSTDTVCYGGTPQIGLVRSFKMMEIPEESEFLGETVRTYDAPGVFDPAPGAPVSIPSELENDIWASVFERRCSGTRGNMCNGQANQHLQRIVACTPDRREGELETCSGPTETELKNPISLGEKGAACLGDDVCRDERRCVNGNCYEVEGELMACKTWSGTKENWNSFEKAFGLTRRDGAEANGICSEQPTCSDGISFNPETREGTHIATKATCGGDGKCSLAVETEDCSMFNGLAAAGLDSGYYCEKEGEQLVSSLFQCQKPETECKRTGNANPDTDKRLCDACLNSEGRVHMQDPPAGVMTTYKERRGGIEDRRCCGDDLGEGGYPYVKTNPAVSLSKNVNAGKYEEERETVCDDTYRRGLLGISIDNDCDNNANCRDSDCRGRIGPGKGYCCNIDDDCISAGSKLFESSPAGVDCKGDTKECDCLSIEGDSIDEPYREMNYKNVRTCVASEEAEDRFIRVLNIPAGLRIFTISSTEIDGREGDCDGNIRLRVYVGEMDVSGGGIFDSDSYFIGRGNNVIVSFQNEAGKDCLVSVGIR